MILKCTIPHHTRPRFTPFCLWLSGHHRLAFLEILGLKCNKTICILHRFCNQISEIKWRPMPSVLRGLVLQLPVFVNTNISKFSLAFAHNQLHRHTINTFLSLKDSLHPIMFLSSCVIPSLYLWNYYSTQKKTKWTTIQTH